MSMPAWLRLQTSRSQVFFILSLTILAAVFFVYAVWGGHRLLVSGHLWPDNILFGFDNARNIHCLTEPGANERNHIHPYFYPMFKPLCYKIEALRISPGTAAVILNAAAGALGLLLTAVYLGLRRVSRIDVWLVVFFMASTVTWIMFSAMPNTFIFSLCVIVCSNMLMIWNLRRPDEQLPPNQANARARLWLFCGVINYGITVTNLLMSWINYGLGQKGKRAAQKRRWYMFDTLAAGLFLTLLASGWFNVWVESQWITNMKLRGGPMPCPLLHSISTNLFWGFVAPIPRVAYSMPDSKLLPIVTFHDWRYNPAGWLLVATWTVILLLAIGAIFRDRDPESRRCSLALGLFLTFHIVMHRFYNTTFEGVFVYNGHSLFPVIGLLAPLMVWSSRWPTRWIWLFRGVLFVMAVMLTVRHAHLLLELPRLVPLSK